MAKRRAQGEGGLFKRGDGLWVASVPYHDADGYRKFKRKYSKSHATAVENLRELQEQVSQGVTGPSLTVEEWLDEYLRDVIKPSVRPRTYNSYEALARLHIKPHIGHIKLSKLTAADVRKMHRAAPTPQAAGKAHQLLHQALKDAVVERKVQRNVTAEMRRPTTGRSEVLAFTPNTAKHIMRVAHEMDERTATRWVAAFYTGARQGEILGLQWSHVNLDEGFLDLSWQLQQLQKAHGCGGKCGRSRPGYCPEAKWDLPPGFEYRVIHRSLCLTRPKSEAGQRIVPIAPVLLEMLKLEAQRPGPNPHGLVWHHADGRPIDPRRDSRAWHDLLVAAEVDEIKLHAVRHTTATLLMDAGVDVRVIQAIVGHSSAAMTRAYQHVDLSMARTAISRLSDRLR